MRVVITGASRGIGAAMAEKYRDRGDEVIGTSRQGGGGLIALNFDQDPDFSALHQAVGDGPVDLLICNAGVYPDKGQSLADGFGADLWRQGMFVNVAGPFLTIQTLLPALEKSQAGKIAVISSAMGSNDRAPGGSYVYRASKAAAVNLTRNLAQDLGPKGIAIGAYHPGWVRTDMGGDNADIDVDTSSTGLVARFDALGPQHTGVFETYDGQPIPF
ncbi:SDR family oxidoreductase [Pseudooceanicola sp. MF1-13]|uniref:SDR family oxidoreductase n=1 Tax=Pseudooceanicola sp. MF1-13 TaxID=3379095 RepID=UPI003891EBFF